MRAARRPARGRRRAGALAALLGVAAGAAALAETPAPARAGRALLVVACDDRAAIHVNGESVGEIPQWDLPFSLDVSRDVFPMVVAVEAQNFGGPGALVGALKITASDGAARETAARWRCSATAEPGWNLPHFDDGFWTEAADVTPSGVPPWGPGAGVGLERASPLWLAPPARPNETIYCRWRIESPAFRP